MMRFGSTTIPLTGWTVNPRQPDLERVRRLQAIRQIVVKYDFQAVELSLDFALLYPQVFNREFYRAAADLQQELGFTCTLHLPFLWLDPCSMNEIMRKASVQAICKGFELASALRIESCVLHLWGNMTQLILSLRQNPPEMVELLLIQAGHSLDDLGECIPQEKICVETLEKPSFDIFGELVERHAVRICLDVGHLYWQKEGYDDFLKCYGNFVAEVHLHDARRKIRERGSRVLDHLSLGEGDIDPATFLNSLEMMGYQGAVILENNNLEDFEKSVAWLKQWGEK